MGEVIVKGVPELPEGYSHLEPTAEIKPGDKYYNFAEQNWYTASKMIEKYCPGFIAIPETKIIDMTAAIESGVDCEFCPGIFDTPIIDSLSAVSDSGYWRSKGGTWSACRIRQDHTHYHNGSAESPIPDGLMVTVHYRDRSPDDRMISNCVHWGDVEAYIVDDTAPRYKYKHELGGGDSE